MLAGVAYVPLLHARPAEMRALTELPALSKNRILPVISARPWLNSRSLDRLWERLGEVVGERQFAVDLDRTRHIDEDEREAYREFRELFDAADGYRQYYQTVGDIPLAVPVLRSQEGRFDQLSRQLDQIDHIGRGAIVRLEHDQQPEVGTLLEGLYAAAPENVAIVVDCGWSRDVLGRADWASQIVRLIADHDPNQEIVVSGSSFPASFTGIGERGEFPIDERTLFNEVRRQHNLPNLTYGDWGSTRPPTPPTPMVNVPRIDLPTEGSWISFRKVEDEVGYVDVAGRVLDDDEWPQELGIWGTYMIESTAQGLQNSITHPAAATAARVNIHLHQQTNFESPEGLAQTEEPYVDEV